MITTIPFVTTRDTELVDVTDLVREVVKGGDFENGLCIIYSPHTTAGMTINSTSDPAGAEDILNAFDQLVPIRANFKHTLDTPADAAGHIKLVLVGNSVNVPIQNGELVLGHSQSILFYEFDGPRDRIVQVQIIAEDKKN